MPQFMLQSWFRRFLFLLLILLIQSCVSVPSHVQLMDMDTELGLARIDASCSYGRAKAIPSGTQSTVLDANRISLINWNIYKAQRENWESDFRTFIQQQDIVVLQEAVLIDALSRTLSGQDMHWSLNTAFYYDDTETGVLTASRVRAVRSCGLRADEPMTGIPKTMLVTEYRLSNGQPNLLVANIHGINFTLGTDAYRQQVMALAEAIRQHTGPVIVAGDFNTWSDDRMAIVDEMVEQLSLSSVTYRNHNRLTVFGNPLDHVFYRGLELLEEETLSVTSSDHNPIRVTFKATKPLLAGNRL